MTRYFEHTVSVKIKLTISIENFSLFVVISMTPKNFIICLF